MPSSEAFDSGLVLRRNVSSPVPARGWTKQLSRVSAVVPVAGPDAAGILPGARETLAFPTAAFQNGRLTLQERAQLVVGSA